MVGCMLTWTTYGTWLQGDRRGYVKNAEVLPADEDLYRANQKQMKFEPVRLSRKQRSIVRKTILGIAGKAEQKIFALAIAGNHLHLLLEPAGEPFGRVVSRYKILYERRLKRRVSAVGYGQRVLIKDIAIVRKNRLTKFNTLPATRIA